MADKLRTTYPLRIQFFEGEQPTALKLSAISSQAKSGLNIIEKAIGDLWGNGGDLIGAQIPTLGRTFGENRFVNPALYSLQETFYYIEKLNVVHAGNTTGYLTFKPVDNPGSAGTYNIVFGDGSTNGAALSYTSKTTEGAVSAATDYWIDSINGGSTGRFRFGDAFASGTVVYIGYWVDPEDWNLGKEDIVPGVIPDPRTKSTFPLWLTTPGTGTAPYDYTIQMPLRGPLEVSGTNKDYFDTLPEIRPKRVEFGASNLDLNSLQGLAAHGAFGSGLEPRLWSSVDPSTDDQFYRYKVPLLEKSPYVGANTRIPDGTLYLCYYDSTSKNYQVVEGLEYWTGSNTYDVNIKDTANLLQAAIAANSGDDPQRWALITCSPSLTKRIWALDNAFSNHTHDGSNGEFPVSHSALIGNNPGENKDDIPWEKSILTSDDHIQYLHRDGNVQRDSNKGAMLGDLILSENAESSGDYLGNLVSNDSNRLYFGDHDATNNPSIYGAASKTIKIDGSLRIPGGVGTSVSDDGVPGVLGFGSPSATWATPGRIDGVGRITFDYQKNSTTQYADNAHKHGIASFAEDNDWADSLKISSYDNLFFVIDSSGNSTSVFKVSAGADDGTGTDLFTIDESGNATVTGELGATQFVASAGDGVGAGYAFDTQSDSLQSGIQLHNGGSDLNPAWGLAINSTSNVEVNLDTNDPNDALTSSFVINSVNTGTYTEVFKVDETGDLDLLGDILGDTTITGDLWVEGTDLYIHGGAAGNSTTNGYGADLLLNGDAARGSYETPGYISAAGSIAFDYQRSGTGVWNQCPEFHGIGSFGQGGGARYDSMNAGWYHNVWSDHIKVSSFRSVFVMLDSAGSGNAPSGSTSENVFQISTNVDMSLTTDVSSVKDLFTVKESGVTVSGNVSHFILEDGVFLTFKGGAHNWYSRVDSSNNIYFQYNGAVRGYIAPSATSSGLMNFTGQHTVISEDTGVQENVNNYVGMIVSSTGSYRNVQIEESVYAEEVTINEALPMITLSASRNDKKIFGVISNAEDPNESRTFDVGTFVSVLDKVSGDDRITVNSLGEGGIWVCNINGPLFNGDYITTCEAPGLGMLQADDILHNYTVAKITCDCDFDLNSTVYRCEEFEFNGETYKKAFVGCTYHCG